MQAVHQANPDGIALVPPQLDRLPHLASLCFEHLRGPVLVGPAVHPLLPGPASHCWGLGLLAWVVGGTSWAGAIWRLMPRRLARQKHACRTAVLPAPLAVAAAHQAKPPLPRQCWLQLPGGGQSLERVELLRRGNFAALALSFFRLDDPLTSLAALMDALVPPGVALDRL